MTILSTLVVQIVADTADYLSGLNSAGEMTSNFAGSAVDGLSSLGGTLVAGALAGAAAGITALGFGIKGAADEAMAAQNIMAQTSAVIESTGGAAGMTADEVSNLAGALSEVTTFEDDTIQSAENLLLTFTSIGKEVFPDATETVLDMSQALGQDLKSSAVQLGKALQDPVAGISALSRVGVNFTDDQKLMIEEMVKAGDTMGAQKFILAELNREFGGSARAAAETASGGWTVLMNKLGNIKETIGASVLPAFGSLVQILGDLLEREDVKQFITDVADGLGNLAQTAAENLPGLAQSIQGGFDWLMNNKGLIVATLAVITVAIVAWAVTSAIAIAPLVMELLPVVAVILLIGVLAYVLYTAWTQNWGGIQEKTAEAWAFLEPILSGIADWFKTYIPYAWSQLQQYWTGTMMPMFQDIGSTLDKNIPTAIAFLMLKWGELQNTMAIVGDWVEKHLFPLFSAMGDLLGIVLPPLVNGFSILWDKFATLLGNYVSNSIQRVMDLLGFLGGALGGVGQFIRDVVVSNFIILTSIIDGVTLAVEALVNALTTIVLPDWMGGDTAANVLAVPAGAGGASSGIGPQLRVMPGIQMTYVDNATIRSGETNELVDKLGTAFAQFLKQAGLL